MPDPEKASFGKSLSFQDPLMHCYAYPLGFHLLGKIYEKKGEKQRAIEKTEKFLYLWKDADPDLIDAKEHLVRLTGVSKK